MTGDLFLLLYMLSLTIAVTIAVTIAIAITLTLTLTLTSTLTISSGPDVTNRLARCNAPELPCKEGGRRRSKGGECVWLFLSYTSCWGVCVCVCACMCVCVCV